jgi:predicted unusual protein kinase regulating ubiquinone biosynthesis (AarF/ABC1/UbiB family)
MRLYMLMDILRSILNEQVRHMFDEIDYILEGKNAERFASLYGDDLCVFFDSFTLITHV